MRLSGFSPVFGDSNIISACCLHFFEGVCLGKKRKPPRHFTSDVEEKDVTETEDIYDDTERERMLEEDEITAAENAFMEGREVADKKMRRRKKVSHDDSVSVELAEEDYRED
jgi:hypothetical protein